MVKGTNYEGPHYEMLTVLLLLPLSNILHIHSAVSVTDQVSQSQ